MAVETAVESRMLTGKMVMRDCASGWSVKRWEGSEPGKIVAWIV